MKDMKQVLELAIKLEKELNTTQFKKIEFESCRIDEMDISILKTDDNILVNATTICNGNIVPVASGESKVMLHSIATCAANILGYTGEWSFNKIQEQIEKEEQERLEFSEFCESLGWEN
jgi:hypothetical protein